MKVSNEIDIYEVDGEEPKASNRPKMVINSHWNRDEMVEIVIEEKRYTVSARSLRKAIDNATNWR